MNVPCPVCSGRGGGWSRSPYGQPVFTEHCNACGGTGYQDDGAGSVGINPELNASSRLADAEAKIRELGRLLRMAPDCREGTCDCTSKPRNKKP